MRIYIIANDGIMLCREAPAAGNEGEIAVASNAELHAAPLSAKRLLALWNALLGVEKRKKAGDRDALIDQLWSAIEMLPDPEPQPDPKRPSKLSCLAGDRGFESLSLQRRVYSKPEFREVLWALAAAELPTCRWSAYGCSTLPERVLCEMPNARQTSLIASPSSSRATNRRRSTITDHSFHCIHASPGKGKGVTHVSGTICHLCLGPLTVTSGADTRVPISARSCLWPMRLPDLAPPDQISRQAPGAPPAGTIDARMLASRRRTR